MTQAELAPKLKVPQGVLSRMEAGVSTVGEALLPRFAEALDYPIAFFQQPELPLGLGTEAYHQLYRKRKALPAKALRRIEAQVNIVRMHTDQMLKAVELEHDRVVPKLSAEEYGSDVEQIAATVRAAWLLPSGPVASVMTCLEDAGVVVVPFDFGTDQVDATSLRAPNGPPLVIYNRNLLGDRLRFTLAHELGHLVMHSLVPDPAMEEQADRFASEFLMPAREISPSLNRLSIPRAAQLKQFWKVSMASLIYRAGSLGKLTTNQAKYLWVQMSAAGYRTREPRELDVPIERPRIHRELLDSHLQGLGYTVAEFAQMLNSGLADLQKFYHLGLPQVGALRMVSSTA